MNFENPRSGHESVIDLAREAPFRLGDLRVSPSTREVERDGQREALEPRVMQVLVVLYRADGGVVSRDDLIARCWEGRIVGEDAVSRAIWRLRKLAEADGYANFTIETIPRVGYRLLTGDPAALAKAVMDETAPTPESGPTAPAVIAPAGGKARGRRLAAGLALLGVVSCALAAWLLWPARHWTVVSSRPFILSLALEGYPAFSPNGAMLAYSSGPDMRSRQIYARNLAGGDGIRITNDAYDDTSPSWSSDGARLAYIAVKPGEPCRIMVAAVPAGEAREVGRCLEQGLSFVTWQPGTQFLYYNDGAGAERDAIFRLDMDTGQRRQITSYSKIAVKPFRDLHCSPDGKSLLYLWLGNYGTRRIMIRDLASGKERALGSLIQNSAAAWSEDSKAVLAGEVSGQGIAITAYPVDGSAPYRLYTATNSVGGGDAPRLATGGGFLAMEFDISRTNLARASLTPISQPDVIDPANGMTWSPTFAPDGTLAFLSTRTGANAVWVMKNGAAPSLLFDSGEQILIRENFSPDGSRLALVRRAPAGVNVKILTVDGAPVSSFDLPDIGRGLPTWTPDGKAVIVYDGQPARATRIDVADPARRSPVAAPDWQGVTIRAEGTFATRAEKPGIWRIDKEVRLINGKFPAAWHPPLAFLGEDVLIPDFDAPGGPRILAQPVAGGPDRVLAYAPGSSAGTKLAVNPRTGEIIYVASVARDTNIDLLTLAKR